MFGTLLESRARRHRRTGGAALSVAAHMAIIGVATAATMHGKAAPPTPPKPEFLVFRVAPAPKPIERRQTAAPPTSSRSYAPAPVPLALTIAPPSVTPPSLPAIDVSHVTTSDIVSIGGPPPGSPSGQRGGKLDLTSGDGSPGEWDSHELLMHIITSAKPRYPETLRQSGIGGRVLVQFSVDTTGRVDMTSIHVIQSTHDLFTQAVRSALGAFRFRPAEVNGRRTAALAEMPFEFQVR
jgi:protein TonB